MGIVMHKNIKFKILSEGQTNGISSTCRKYNISRTIYYRWLKRYKEEGMEGLDSSKKNFVPKNKTSPEIENVLLNLFKNYPKYGPKAIKYLIEELGYEISESAVYNVMKRHNLTNKESRIKFAKKKKDNMINTLPPLNELNSGECWILWSTYYGNFNKIGNIYEYTVFDFKSRIACSRLYLDKSFNHFEDLLTAAAIPVAQTLKLNVKFFCFFQDSKMTKHSRNIFNSKISEIIQDNGLDAKMHIINTNNNLVKFHELRKQYTEGCISFLMPLIRKGMQFDELKIQFQRYIRRYNINHKLKFDCETCSPIEYHKKLTNNQPILPLWAYIDRLY